MSLDKCNYWRSIMIGTNLQSTRDLNSQRNTVFQRDRSVHTPSEIYDQQIFNIIQSFVVLTSPILSKRPQVLIAGFRCISLVFPCSSSTLRCSSTCAVKSDVMKKGHYTEFIALNAKASKGYVFFIFLGCLTPSNHLVS